MGGQSRIPYPSSAWPKRWDVHPLSPKKQLSFESCKSRRQDKLLVRMIIKVNQSDGFLKDSSLMDLLTIHPLRLGDRLRQRQHI